MTASGAERPSVEVELRAVAIVMSRTFHGHRTQNPRLGACAAGTRRKLADIARRTLSAEVFAVFRTGGRRGRGDGPKDGVGAGSRASLGGVPGDPRREHSLARGAWSVTAARMMNRRFMGLPPLGFRRLHAPAPPRSSDALRSRYRQPRTPVLRNRQSLRGPTLARPVHVCPDA